MSDVSFTGAHLNTAALEYSGNGEYTGGANDAMLSDQLKKIIGEFESVVLGEPKKDGGGNESPSSIEDFVVEDTSDKFDPTKYL